MILASLAGALLASGAGAGPADCTAQLCGAAALAPYFDALRSLREGQARSVHVLQIGDSHSAGDSITGPWREALQARYGDGGRGVLPPGKPFIGFLPHGVDVAQTAGWSVESTWSTRGQSPESRPAFGLSSFRLTANQPGAGLSLTAAPQNAFTRLTVCAETAPGAGGYVVTLGQLTTHVSLSDPSVRVACANFEAQQPQTVATLTTEGGPVTLTSWASFSDKPGVVVSNLGVVGTQLRHFAETSDAAVGEELRAYRPDLIVLAFGTNEGFSGHFDAYAYEAGLRNQITRLRRLSGNVPILLLGPPDAETRRRDLLHNDDSGAPAASEAARPLNIDDLLDAAPTPDSEPPPSSRSDLPWYPPPALAQIRAIQRRVAASMGTAFWDWCAAEGGPGSADRMANSVPPLRRGDHVHYTTAGGAVIARMLQSDLDAAAASPRAD